MRRSDRAWRRGWVGNALLAVGTLVTLFGVMELVLALLVPGPVVWRYPQESYVYDPRLLHRLRPNQEAFTHAVRVTTNSYGLRNEEVSLTPPPGVFRILCLGDSLTFGNGVDGADTYPKRLEMMLNASGLGRYEVINGGVAAYDTWQEAIYLREYGLEFEPHFVIIGFYANDIVSRPRNLSARRAPVDGNAVMESRADWAVYWLKRSRFLLLLRERVGGLVNRVNPSAGFSHKMALLRGTPHPGIDAGLREVDWAFREFRVMANRHGFGVLLVVFPMADQLLQEFADASYPGNVREIAARHGIPVLDLMPAFLREFRGFGSLFIEWDGHPNARAYSIVAAEIREYLLANGVGRGVGQVAERPHEMPGRDSRALTR